MIFFVFALYYIKKGFYNGKAILLKNNNVFAQQWLETEEEFKNSKHQLFDEIYSSPVSEENNIKDKYLEDMKQKEKERKEYFQDMKNLLDKNKEE